jgi:hypothetical protein
LIRGKRKEKRTYISRRRKFEVREHTKTGNRKLETWEKQTKEGSILWTNKEEGPKRNGKGWVFSPFSPRHTSFVHI